jgi:glucose-1-phosphate adenylyltransferase
MKEVLSLILGGGRGTRLFPLTMLRSKPAVPVAGKYRLIDIPISNCLNSGFNRIYILTQFLSVSLHRHIANTYKFDNFDRGFVEILAAQQTNEAADWYQGTADAVRQNIRYVQEDGAGEVLILSGDQLYRMDFAQLQKTHRDRQADVTIAVLPVREDQTSHFGLTQVDEDGRVVGFVEKPKTEEQLKPVRMSLTWLESRGIHSGSGSAPRQFLASMGIYMFNRQTLFELLNQSPRSTDFGKEVFPNSIRTHRVYAHLFDGYWEDLGTVKAYHEANLALASDNPPFNFHSQEGIIYTRMRFLPASRMSGAKLEQSLVSDGCVIQAGTQITRSVVGLRSQIGRNVTLKDTVFIGADRFESDAERTRNEARSLPHIGIGDGSVIERAILDKDCRIGKNVRIINKKHIENEEGPNYVIRDGIVVIPKGIMVADDSVI